MSSLSQVGFLVDPAIFFDQHGLANEMLTSLMKTENDPRFISKTRQFSIDCCHWSIMKADRFDRSSSLRERETINWRKSFLFLFAWKLIGNEKNFNEVSLSFSNWNVDQFFLVRPETSKSSGKEKFLRILSSSFLNGLIVTKDRAN